MHTNYKDANEQKIIRHISIHFNIWKYILIVGSQIRYHFDYWQMHRIKLKYDKSNCECAPLLESVNENQKEENIYICIKELAGEYKSTIFHYSSINAHKYEERLAIDFIRFSVHCSMHKQKYPRMWEKCNQKEYERNELHKVFHLN